MGTGVEARAQAAAAAGLLRGAGVDIDFAPVSDTVSRREASSEPRVRTDPSLVASLAGAFVAGLQSGRVAATAKHFPGLGSAVASTDDHA